MSDLSHWDLASDFSIHEIARLAAGAEPHVGEHDLTHEQQGKYRLISQSLNKAADYAWDWAIHETSKLTNADKVALWDIPTTKIFPIDKADRRLPSDILITCVENKYLSPGSHDLRYVRNNIPHDEVEKYDREYVAAWFKLRGIAPLYSFSIKPIANAIDSGPEKRLVRSHHSKKLVALIQAAEAFWGNADSLDKTTHRKNEEVIKWLIDRGFSKSMAEKAASIIRPDWAEPGRPLEK